MELTVQDLIDELQSLENPDAVIRFASQPRWPFEYSVDTTIVQSEDGEKVFLAENRQIGYLPGEIKEELMW